MFYQFLINTWYSSPLCDTLPPQMSVSCIFHCCISASAKFNRYICMSIWVWIRNALLKASHTSLQYTWQSCPEAGSLNLLWMKPSRKIDPTDSPNELQLLTIIQPVGWSVVKRFEVLLTRPSALSSNYCAVQTWSFWVALFVNTDTALGCTEAGTNSG